MPEITLILTNKIGLHARPAAAFVKQASEFRCNIRVMISGRPEVNGKSILGVLGLGAGHGAAITIRAEGDDAEQALAALSALSDRNFGEPE